MTESDEILVMSLPGQGAPYGELLRPLLDEDNVGKEDADATAEVVEEVHEATKMDLRSLLANKTSEELADTRIAHVLLLAAGVAGARLLMKREIMPTYVRGHSAALFTAATIGGALALKQAARHMKARGEAMHESAQLYPGGMAVVSEVEDSALEALCKRLGLDIANYNSPLQRVVGGPAERLVNFKAAVKDIGGRASIFKNWSAGMAHTRFVQLVEDRLSMLVGKVDTPQMPILKNTDGMPTIDPEEVRIDLISATQPVRWSQGTEFLVQKGMTTHVEISPSNKRIVTGLLDDHESAKDVRRLHIADILSLQKE